jgi:DNA excision repair protein ERCC-2
VPVRIAQNHGFTLSLEFALKPAITISVRNLVEHLLRSGDLRMDFFGAARAVEGIRIHQRIQHSRPDTYLAEVSITHSVDSESLTMNISGRIDGIIPDGELPIVEEIKSTQRPLDDLVDNPNPIHWGQAKCYAYMWACQEEVDELGVQLTYVNVSSGEVREDLQTFTLNQLEDFFLDLVNRYRTWLLSRVQWLADRDNAIAETSFPFDSYRAGQRNMAVAVYRSVRDGRHLLVQAATGIGKTMAALFPCIKALGEQLVSKIVFLTARTTGRLAAEKALEILRDRGLRLKSVSITAKEKICFEPDCACLPEECPYADGFFDRINAAVEAALETDALTRKTIEAVAKEFTVCPFELSLELIQWADCVIGDYNYAFDPRVTLQRLFLEDSGPKVALVDEAHNLVDRSRDMFSAQLDKQPLLAFRREIKTDLPQVYRRLGHINSWLATERRRIRDAGGVLTSNHLPREFVDRLIDFLRDAETWLSKNIRTPFRENLLQHYFDVMRFVRVSENFDERYTTIYQCAGDELSIKLYCLDPSVQLQAAWEQCKAAILFSATLTPADYFQDLLGCPEDTAKLDVVSPFPHQNLAVLSASRISTYYQQRRHTCGDISRMIGAFVTQHNGHYLVFFPSYAYLRMVEEAFAGDFGHLDLLIQTPDMNNAERNAFLDRFSETDASNLVGFAVMGGIFGEGIDLKGDRLTGAVVVGVGLPGICPERDLIRAYYDERKGNGFAYAYQYPGINRVLQAAGRVIRTEHDRGAVLLIDQRYAQSSYRSLLPAYWRLQTIKQSSDIASTMDGFWGGR